MPRPAPPAPAGMRIETKTRPSPLGQREQFRQAHSTLIVHRRLTTVLFRPAVVVFVLGAWYGVEDLTASAAHTNFPARRTKPSHLHVCWFTRDQECDRECDLSVVYERAAGSVLVCCYPDSTFETKMDVSAYRPIYLWFPLRLLLCVAKQ